MAQKSEFRIHHLHITADVNTNHTKDQKLMILSFYQNFFLKIYRFK